MVSSIYLSLPEPISFADLPLPVPARASAPANAHDPAATKRRRRLIGGFWFLIGVYWLMRLTAILEKLFAPDFTALQIVRHVRCAIRCRLGRQSKKEAEESPRGESSSTREVHQPPGGQGAAGI